ncbi:uncharacterized protein LOC114458232 [Gouania willdenowi]|uniref:uncharacterized protein LOC114458232 n=1 Tax=Gouania willdenowi TaxID=441366 RepID=UPI0010552E9C|nr:uncharacterized protein LOC114458232 [Gouania willdenowi]
MMALLAPPPSTVPAPHVFKDFLEGVWSISDIESAARNTDVIMPCDSPALSGHVTTEAHWPPSLTSPLPSAAGFFTRAVQKLSSSCRRRLPLRFLGGPRGTIHVPPNVPPELRCEIKKKEMTGGVSIVPSLLHRHSSEGEHASSSQGSSAGVVPHSCEVSSTYTPFFSQSFHRGTHRVFMRTNLNIKKMNDEDELVSTLSSGSSQRPSAVSIISSFSQHHQHHQDLLLEPQPPSPQVQLSTAENFSDQRRSGRSFTGNIQRHTPSFKAKGRTAFRGVSETTSRGGVRDRKCPPQQEVSVRSVQTLREEPRGTKAERSRNPPPTGTGAGRGTIMGTLRLQKAPPSPYTKVTAPRRPQRCSSDSSSVLSGELPPAMGRSALFYSSSGYGSIRTSPAHTPRAHRSPRRRGQGVLKARLALKVKGQKVDSQGTWGHCDVMM